MTTAPKSYPLPFAGAQVRRVIGAFMPLLQRLKCQLLLQQDGFDLGTVQALREDHPTDPDARALRILQRRAERLVQSRWLRYVPVGPETRMAQAARDGVLELVKALRANRCRLDVTGICEAAAEGGQLEILKWAMAEGSTTNQWTCSAAAFGGHLEVLQWVKAGGCYWDEDTCAAAAEGGHLEVLKWARAQGCPWDGRTCTAAARGGHLEVLQWARAQDRPCRWNVFTCKAVATRGHLEILQWLRAQDPPCPWDEGTCAWAARGGYMETLQWLRSQGCPWNEWTCDAAVDAGQREVLNWLRAQNPPCPWDKSTRKRAIRRGILQPSSAEG